MKEESSNTITTNKPSCCFRYGVCLMHRSPKVPFEESRLRYPVCRVTWEKIQERNKKPPEKPKTLNKEQRIKTIEKIKKLIALSGNNPNAPERAEAARMARELMVKYQIQQSELSGRRGR